MKSLGATILVTLALLAFVWGVLPVAIFIGWMAYEAYFPAYSAEMRIPEVSAVVRLEAYVQDHFMGGPLDRFLVVKTPAGSATQKMEWLWRTGERTSVYLTETNDIVVLGPDGNDYLIRVKPLRTAEWFELMPDRWQSDKWRYLGVFALKRENERSFLRYYSADEQEECVPTNEPDRPHRHRPQAYREQCPS